MDGTMAALAMLGSAPCGFKPLPVGAYPDFDGFPQFVVNYQAELRERVVKQEREMETKRRMVRDGKPRESPLEVPMAAAAAATAAAAAADPRNIRPRFLMKLLRHTSPPRVVLRYFVEWHSD